MCIRDSPFYEWKGMEVIKHNQQILRTNLFPVKSLNLFLDKMDNGLLQVHIENFGRFPVEILALENKEGKKLGTLTTNTIVLSNNKQLVSVQLDANFSKQFVSKKFNKTGFTIKEDLDKLRIVYQTVGTTPTKRATILPWAKEQQLPSAIFTENSLSLIHI